MSTHEERLNEHDMEIAELERKCEAAFKQIDSFKDSRADITNAWTIWRASVDYAVKEIKDLIKELDLVIWVHDTNSFVTTSRRIIWGVGIPILILLITNLVLIGLGVGK